MTKRDLQKMMNSKLRIAVLGAGNWAKSAHIPGWQRDPRSEVAILCDPQKERANEFAKMFNIPLVSSDWQEVVARNDIDVIDV
jgi:predicted dehydrogenase